MTVEARRARGVQAVAPGVGPPQIPSMQAPLSADTSAAASEVQLSAWRAMSPADKLAQVRGLTAAVLLLEREGLRRRHPSLGPDELHLAAIARRLGPALAARAYSQTRRER